MTTRSWCCCRQTMRGSHTSTTFLRERLPRSLSSSREADRCRKRKHCCATAGVKPHVRFAVDSDYNVMNMVSKGLGFSILPGLLLEDTVLPLAVLSPHQEMRREISIAMRSADTASAATRAFGRPCARGWRSATSNDKGEETVVRPRTASIAAGAAARRTQASSIAAGAAAAERKPPQNQNRPGIRRAREGYAFA